jgi:hypothetical protein
MGPHIFPLMRMGGIDFHELEGCHMSRILSLQKMEVTGFDMFNQNVDNLLDSTSSMDGCVCSTASFSGCIAPTQVGIAQ